MLELIQFFTNWRRTARSIVLTRINFFFFSFVSIMCTEHICVSIRAEKIITNQLKNLMKLNVKNLIVVSGEFRDPVDKIAWLSGRLNVKENVTKWTVTLSRNIFVFNYYRFAIHFNDLKCQLIMSRLVPYYNIPIFYLELIMSEKNAWPSGHRIKIFLNFFYYFLLLVNNIKLFVLYFILVLCRPERIATVKKNRVVRPIVS